MFKVITAINIRKLLSTFIESRKGKNRNLKDIRRFWEFRIHKAPLS